MPMQTRFASSSPIIPLEAATNSSCAAAPVLRQATPIEDEAPPGVAHMALMLTRRCNMSCGHCSVESSPHIKGEPSAEELLQAVRAAHAAGVRSLLLTGGEPMLREKIVLQLLRECRQLGMTTAMASNGFWGKTPDRARDTVARLQEAGLRLLAVSYDRYHADYQGPEPTLNVARAAVEAKLPVNIAVTRTAQEADLDAIIAPFSQVPQAMLRFYDVQPIGRARNFELETLRGEIGGFCNACNSPALADDGRLLACNGPAYFSAHNSPLIVGTTADATTADATAADATGGDATGGEGARGEGESLEALLRRHRRDPILEAIRTDGPEWLLGELQKLPGFENWARPAYGGMCDLCLHLNSDGAATAALRAHLSDGRLVAERAARRYVIEASRRDALNRDAVNSVEAMRVWWRAARDPATLREPNASAILGRADLNWSAQLEYLSECGLAGPLARALNEPQLKRWAPAFFVDKLGERAMAQAMRTVLQLDMLRQIAAVAREVGASGVVLKGGAMLALDAETPGASGAGASGAEALPLRAGSDLDIYFAPAEGERVHARLRELGYQPVLEQGTLDVAGDYQLPQLKLRGLLVELHHGLLPHYCGAPEKQMLRARRALRAPEMRGLSVLSPEAMLLHTLLHSSKHLWAHGLKTAYDVAWICERFPELNWNWLARLVARTGMKRGFWVPLTLLTRELKLPVPAHFLARAPRDGRERKLESIARGPLFNMRPAWFNANPWVYHPLNLLMSDSWLHRARHVARIALGRHAVQLRAQRAAGNSGYQSTRWQRLAHALRAWRRL